MIQNHSTLCRVESIPWIKADPDVPYFVTDHGDSWMPIGQNDAILWPDMQGLYRRKDMNHAEK